MLTPKLEFLWNRITQT